MNEMDGVREETDAEFASRITEEIIEASTKISKAVDGTSLPVVTFACLEIFASAAATCPPEVVGLVEEQVQRVMDKLRSTWAMLHEGATGVKQ